LGTDAIIEEQRSVFKALAADMQEVSVSAARIKIADEGAMNAAAADNDELFERRREEWNAQTERNAAAQDALNEEIEEQSAALKDLSQSLHKNIETTEDNLVFDKATAE
jgi:hypothetical protein